MSTEIIKDIENKKLELENSLKSAKDLKDVSSLKIEYLKICDALKSLYFFLSSFIGPTLLESSVPNNCTPRFLVGQWSPTFRASGTSFVVENFSMDLGVGDFGMI